MFHYIAHMVSLGEGNEALVWPRTHGLVWLVSLVWFGWFAGWLVGRLVGWLVDWLIGDARRAAGEDKFSVWR